MKKQTKKLRLSSESLRNLCASSLSAAAGGNGPASETCTASLYIDDPHYCA